MGNDYTLEGPKDIKKHGLPPFIKVKIGGDHVMTPDLLAHEVELHGHTVSSKARELMAQEAFTVHLDETLVSLCLISPRSLGLRGNVTMAQFYNELEVLRVEKCLPDIGPLGRIEFSHQPPWSNVHVYMEPIPNSGGKPSIFTLSRYFRKEVGNFNHVDSTLGAVVSDPEYAMPDTFQWLAILPEEWELS